MRMLSQADDTITFGICESQRLAALLVVTGFGQEAEVIQIDGIPLLIEHGAEVTERVRDLGECWNAVAFHALLASGAAHQTRPGPN
jgi:hypothetical protein